MNNLSLILSHNEMSAQRVCLKCCEINKAIIGGQRRRKITIFSMREDNAVIPDVRNLIL
jgi:hypothetical protein